jgi:hypothetical protein
MKTYAKNPFDWWKALENPPKYDNIDQDDLADMAGTWVTCACGNQCEAIPRRSDGEPWDEDLRDLGLLFYYQIRDLEWEEAKETLRKIEIRSAEILTGLEKP